MSMKDVLRQRKQDLLKRQQESSERKTERFGSIFLKDKIPEGIPFFIPDSGKEHIIDIVPFIPGPKHPTDSGKDISYMLDLYTHKGIGLGNEHIICMFWTYGKIKPCYPCEWMGEHWLAKEDYAKVKPIRRNVYLVYVRDNAEERRKGLQIWEVPYFFFEQHIDGIKKLPQGGGQIQYLDVDNGKSIAFSIEKKGKDNIAYTNHRFVDRVEPIPDKVIDQSFELDSVINFNRTYEEVKGLFLSTNREAPTRTGRGVNPPTPEKAKPQGSDEPDIPDKHWGTPKQSSGCPYGHKFGETILDPTPDCDPCEKWDACSEEAERLNTAPAPAPNPTPAPAPAPQPPDEGRKFARRRTR